MPPPDEEQPAQKKLVCQSCKVVLHDNPRGIVEWNEHVKRCKGKTAVAFLKPETQETFRRKSTRATPYARSPMSPRSPTSISPSSSSPSFNHLRRPSEPVIRQLPFSGLSPPSASARYPGNGTRSASQSHLPTPAHRPLPLDIPSQPQNLTPQSDGCRYANGQITTPVTPEPYRSIPAHDSPPSVMPSSSSSSSSSSHWNSFSSQSNPSHVYPPSSATSWSGSPSPAMHYVGSSSSTAQWYPANHQNNSSPYYSPMSPTNAGPSPDGNLAVPSVDAHLSLSVASDLASGLQPHPDPADLLDGMSAQEIGDLFKRFSQSGFPD